MDDHTVPRHADLDGNGTSVVLLMVRDAYANYVVQTTLDVLPDTEGRRGLLAELNMHVEELVSPSLHCATCLLVVRYLTFLLYPFSATTHSQSIL